MGILDRFRHNKAEEAEDMATPAYTNTAVNNVTQPRSPGERADRRDKGIDIDMIDPEEVMRELQGLAHFERTVKKREPKLVGEGINAKLGYEDTETTFTETRPWAVAALVYLNKVWPTIWMSPYEADTKKLVLRTAFYDIRKSMNPDEKRKYGIILKAVENLCVSRLEDTKDGHKPLLMKVESHRLEVTTNRGLTTKQS
jgi:hypothetical protein